MKGHDNIIAMRRAGQRPALVFINDYPCAVDWLDRMDHATVDVSGDQPEWLDLRFLVGLRVSITGSTEKRAKRLMEACKRAGCVTVAAGAPEFRNGRWWESWGEVWHKPSEDKEAA